MNEGTAELFVLVIFFFFCRLPFHAVEKDVSFARSFAGVRLIFAFTMIAGSFFLPSHSTRAIRGVNQRNETALAWTEANRNVQLYNETCRTRA